MWTQVRRAGASALIFLLGAAAEGCIPDDDCSVTATCPPPETDAADAEGSITRRDASTLPDARTDTAAEGGDALMQFNTIPLVDGAPASDAPGAAVPCADGTKRCGDQCVSLDDPTFGCGPKNCDKIGCPDPGAGTLVCQNGACTVGTCPDGTKKCGAACVAVDDPTYGCGLNSCAACAKISGASTVCSGGACVVGTCASGTKKCGDRCAAIDDVSYGCGANTCDKSTCPAVENATLGCQNGTCVIVTCGAGTKKCGGKCVSIDDPTYGCGAMSCDASSCPASGSGSLVCSGGTCTIGVCGAGTKKCGNKCVPVDRNSGCGDPAVCTACGANEICVGSPSVCKCVPNNDACMGKGCGAVVNNCGQTVSCGSCVVPQTCNGGGIVNKCGCSPVNPCSGGKCGTGLSDGCGGTVDCKCSGSNTCGGGGTVGVCGCTKKTCAGLCGAQSDGCGGTMQCPACCIPKTCAAGQCGTISNGCGATLNCPTSCPGEGQTCGGGGTANVCGCTDNNAAACSGKVCGTVTNNCGKTVTCTPNACTAPADTVPVCTSNQCTTACASDTTPLACSERANLACGRWRFESADAARDWSNLPASAGNREGAAGPLFIAAPAGGDSGKLGIRFNAPDGNNWVFLRVGLCPRATSSFGAFLTGKHVSVRAKLVFDSGVSNGTFLPVSYIEIMPKNDLSGAPFFGITTTFIDGFNAGEWQTLDGVFQDLPSMTAIAINVNISTAGTGILYVDDLWIR